MQTTPYYRKKTNKPFVKPKRRVKGVYMSKKGRSYPSSYNNAARATIQAYPAPQKMLTNLVFSYNTGLVSALTSSHSLVFRPTSYFDADPLIGGGTFAGYTFYSGMYARYRVLAFSYKVTFVNLEAQGVIVSTQCIADSATPVTGTAVDWTEPAEENEYGRVAILPPVTSNPMKVLRGYVSTVKLWGTPEAATDNDWAGAVGASPPVNSWLRVSAHYMNGSPMTAGVQIHVRIKSYGYWDQKESDTVG